MKWDRQQNDRAGTLRGLQCSPWELDARLVVTQHGAVWNNVIAFELVHFPLSGGLVSDPDCI